MPWRNARGFYASMRLLHLDAAALELVNRLEQQGRSDRQQVTHVRGVEVCAMIVGRRPGLVEEARAVIGAVKIVV